MLHFLGWRCGRALLTLWVVFTLVFFSTRISGNAIDFIWPEGADPVSRQTMIQYLGLDRSLVEQYGLHVRSLLQGDFGLSFYERRPVLTMYTERLAATVSLSGGAFILSLLIGIPCGILAAIKRQTMIGRFLMSGAMLGYATPHFILGILFILTFSLLLGWLPSAGNHTVAHWVMPTLTLAAALAAAVARFTRSAILEVLSQDYVRTARAKGLIEHVVVLKHALRNALIPVITILGLQATALVAGSVVIETVFAWPGIGELLVTAVIGRDYPTVQCGVMLIAALVVLVNFSVDLLYAVVDPRIRLEE
jgi:ABC-type dipeptide/oligopeptide/nickel transport system permease component